MKFNLIIISVLMSAMASGQSKGFDLMLNSSELNSKSYKIIEFAGDGYIISYTTNEYESDKRTVMLAKISTAGDVLSQVELSTYEHYYYSAEIIKVNTESFISLFYIKDENGNCYLKVIKYDSSLNSVWEREHPIEYNFITFYESVIDNQGLIVSTGFCEAEDILHRHLCLIKLNSNNGDITKMKVFEDSNMGIGFGLLSNKSDNGYRVFAEGYSDWVMMKTDSDFNRIDTMRYPIDDYTRRSIVTAQWATDTSYIVSTEKSWWHGSFDESQMGLMVFNLNDELINEADFGKQDTIEYPAYLNSLSVHNSDSIYQAGTSGIVESIFPNGMSYLMINLVDQDLNQHWQKFYGGDAYYKVRTVLATNDGGCIIIADRDDQETEDYRLDTYVLKVNSDGNINTLIGGQTVSENNISIFPNPVSEFLQIDSNVPYNQILINSLKGELLISNQGFNKSLYVGSLKAGLYLYQIQNNSKTIKQGKFLKLQGN